MASSGSATGAWFPETASEAGLVRAQLEKILGDGRFTASKRYPQLLRYIVEQTLAGNEDGLKERTLGVEVFHRTPDYDTNLDPVVRLCAAEVRKRLAQYYQVPAHARELRIELNPGSYIPVFSIPATDASALIVEPTQAPSSPEAPPKTERIRQPRWTRRTLWLTGLMALSVFVVVFLVLGFQVWRQPSKQKSALEDVWSPLVASSKPILFCVGDTETSPLDSPLTDLQHGADDDASPHPYEDMNHFVPFSDVQTLSRFLALVVSHNHAFKVQNFRITVSSQLREGPVVLIGALNNNWTLNRTASLRFHLLGPEGPDQVYWIADAQHPDSRFWQVKAKAPRSQVGKDFAIAARFTDDATGQVVLVAAGIAGSGTRAAGEFLTDEQDLKQLANSAGADWNKKNFEVVLSSQVVNGIQGQPRVESQTFW